MFSKLMIFCIPFILFSCASSHTLMRGTVAMKISKDKAHVCLGDNMVKKGDLVVFYENDCIGTGSENGGGTVCTLKKTGEGEVLKTLNSHYSVIKTTSKFSFDEGTLVQKK